MTARTRLELGVLSPEEAPAVVISVLGAERVLREEDAVDELVRLCGYLPLALRITAANLADRPHQTIAELMAELERRSDGAERAESADALPAAPGGLDRQRLPPRPPGERDPAQEQRMTVR